MYSYDPEGDKIIMHRIKAPVNVGYGRDILKQHIGLTTFPVRSLKQIYGAGVEIIEPLGAGVDEETKDEIEFRRIAGRETGTQQVNVTAASGIIRVAGNGKSGSLKIVNCDGSITTTLLAWDDGLITSQGDISFYAECSSSGSGSLP